MQAGAALQLRDIHAGIAPSWWPPAPGWWLLFTALLLVVGIVWWLRARGRHRARAVARLFDDTLAQAATPAQEIAAMSELLRRAARRRDPQADKLEGDDWLRFLDDGLTQPVFATGVGAVLRDGAFRRDVSGIEVDGLRQVVRSRFVDWMRAKPANAKPGR